MIQLFFYFFFFSVIGNQTFGQIWWSKNKRLRKQTWFMANNKIWVVWSGLVAGNNERWRLLCRFRLLKKSSNNNHITYLHVVPLVHYRLKVKLLKASIFSHRGWGNYCNYHSKCCWLMTLFSFLYFFLIGFETQIRYCI